MLHEDEKSILYLTLIITRLFKLKEISLTKNKNLETAINEIKPPIFWKDKPMFIKQAKEWNEDKIIKALKKLMNLEIKIKIKCNIIKRLLIKKLLMIFVILLTLAKKSEINSNCSKSLYSMIIFLNYFFY